MAAGRLHQSPQPKGGELFRREWWQLWDKNANGNRYPATSYRVASLDGAFTADEANDPSAMTVFGVFKHPTLNAQRIILMDAWRKHLPLHGIRRRGCLTKFLKRATPGRSSDGDMRNTGSASAMSGAWSNKSAPLA